MLVLLCHHCSGHWCVIKLLPQAAGPLGPSSLS